MSYSSIKLKDILKYQIMSVFLLICIRRLSKQKIIDSLFREYMARDDDKFLEKIGETEPSIEKYVDELIYIHNILKDINPKKYTFLNMFYHYLIVFYTGILKYINLNDPNIKKELLEDIQELY